MDHPPKFHAASAAPGGAKDPERLIWMLNAIHATYDRPNGPVVGLKAMKEMYAKFKTDYPEYGHSDNGDGSSATKRRHK